MGIERRRAPRTSVHTTIKIILEDYDDFHEYLSENVSTAGIFIRTAEFLEVGTKVLLIFSLFEGGIDLIEAEGKVVRCDEADPMKGQPPGMAIAFTHLDPDAKTIIDKYVSSHPPKSTPIGKIKPST